MLETKRYSLSEYLNHYRSNGIKGLYKRILEDFFKIIYPKNNSTDLEELSLSYVDGTHDYKGDLIKLRDVHPKDSTMTSQVRFSAVNGFLANNEILISPKFRKDLIGLPKLISEEHIPTRARGGANFLSVTLSRTDKSHITPASSEPQLHASSSSSKT